LGYRVEEKLLLGAREQKGLNINILDNGYRGERALCPVVKAAVT
jgi:hypothetical protein